MGRDLRGLLHLFHLLYVRRVAAVALILYSVLLAAIPARDYWFSKTRQAQLHIGNVPHISPWQWTVVALVFVLLVGFQGSYLEIKRLEAKLRASSEDTSRSDRIPTNRNELIGATVRFRQAAAELVDQFYFRDQLPSSALPKGQAEQRNAEFRDAYNNLEVQENVAGDMFRNSLFVFRATLADIVRTLGERRGITEDQWRKAREEIRDLQSNIGEKIASGELPNLERSILALGDPRCFENEMVSVGSGAVPVRLWRVALRNRIPGKEAKNIRISISDSTPHVSYLPVEPHVEHEDGSLLRHTRNLVFGDNPVNLDIISKQVHERRLFIYRNDRDDRQPGDGHAYALSDGETAAWWYEWSRGNEVTLQIKAVPDLPECEIVETYRLWLDENSDLQMEKVRT